MNEWINCHLAWVCIIKPIVGWLWLLPPWQLKRHVSSWPFKSAKMFPLHVGKINFIRKISNWIWMNQWNNNIFEKIGTRSMSEMVPMLICLLYASYGWINPPWVSTFGFSPNCILNWPKLNPIIMRFTT